MTKIHFLLFIFSLSLLFSLVNAYTDTSFSVTFKLSPDKVQVIEKTVFSLDSLEDSEAFSRSLRLGRSTIVDWKRYSRNIDYHIYGPLVFVNTTRIIAKRDSALTHNPAVVEVQYEINPNILLVKKKSSRVTEYILNTSLLNLNKLRSGEIVLGNIDELSFEIPDGAGFSIIQPDANEVLHNKVIFRGPLTSKFAFSFIIEQTLSQEVNAFFVDTYSNAANLIPLLLVVALLLFVWFKLVSDA